VGVVVVAKEVVVDVVVVVVDDAVVVVGGAVVVVDGAVVVVGGAVVDVVVVVVGTVLGGAESTERSKGKFSLSFLSLQTHLNIHVRGILYILKNAIFH
jgi:hypothetical protein